jgi:hypothetical protein
MSGSVIGSIISAFFAMLSMLAAWFSYVWSRRAARINYVYKIHQDITKWLEEHYFARKKVLENPEWYLPLGTVQELLSPELRKEREECKKQLWDINSFLLYFKALWIAYEKGEADIKVINDLMGDYIIKIHKNSQKLAERLKVEEEIELDASALRAIDNLYNEILKLKREGLNEGG